MRLAPFFDTTHSIPPDTNLSGNAGGCWGKEGARKRVGGPKLKIGGGICG